VSRGWGMSPIRDYPVTFDEKLFVLQRIKEEARRDIDAAERVLQVIEQIIIDIHCFEVTSRFNEV
jgi:hypothetical protein